mgnify:CR=1 FL=1|tara:strand:- start:477 stop:881 length:405 start_codon:yes stop_codon:yes gene_type:complete
MTHLYVLARGIKPVLDTWVNNLLSRFYPMAWKDKHGNNTMYNAQLAVRPIQLYEIVFPKTATNEVLSLIKPGRGNKRPREKKYLSWIRRIMGLDPMPDEWDDIPKSDMINREGLGIMGIGMKEDKSDENGNELL